MNTRDRALDGLRGIAILLVLLMHTVHLQPVRALWGWINALAGAGWLGVDLFFVLSGFLITGILVELRETPQRLGIFYGRRALRILPAYFFYLLVTVPLLLLFAEPRYVALTREMLPWLLLFTQNIQAALADPHTNLGPLSHLWSLSVEEQFYLVWPFVVWNVRLQHLARTALVIALLAVLCKLALAAGDAPAHVAYLLTPTRVDGFAAGAWLAALRCSGRPVPRGLLPLAATAALLLVAALLAQGSSLPRQIGVMALCLSLTPLVFAGALHAALIASPRAIYRRFLETPVLAFFGQHSYALYLVHPGVSVALVLNLMPLLRVWLPGNLGRLALMLLTWLLSIAAALLIDRLIDAPARRRKRHLPLPQEGSAPIVLTPTAGHLG